MCLIAAVERGKLDEESIGYAMVNHGDGAGFSYVRNGQIVTEKGMFTEMEFLKLYSEIPDGPHIIHFRKSTGGKANRLNCHPFQPHLDVVFAHNGTLANIKSDKTFSDTFYFSHGILTDLLRKDGIKTIESNWFPWFLGEAIGTKNKLAFLTSSSKLVIINEDEGCGHWNETKTEKIWFSNYSYCYYESSYNYSNYKGGHKVSSGCANPPSAVQKVTDYYEGLRFDESPPEDVANIDFDLMTEEQWNRYIDHLTTQREADEKNQREAELQQRFTEYEEMYANQCGL
jgi:predicted glutamine amidotransferase